MEVERFVYNKTGKTSHYNIIFDSGVERTITPDQIDKLRDSCDTSKLDFLWFWDDKEIDAVRNDTFSLKGKK